MTISLEELKEKTTLSSKFQIRDLHQNFDSPQEPNPFPLLPGQRPELAFLSEVIALRSLLQADGAAEKRVTMLVNPVFRGLKKAWASKTMNGPAGGGTGISDKKIRNFQD